jgi:hypothetical protein
MVNFHTRINSAFLIQRLISSLAGPGDPAAHRMDRLPLLPSGPGGVHRILLHRARPLYCQLRTMNFDL